MNRKLSTSTEPAIAKKAKPSHEGKAVTAGERIGLDHYVVDKLIGSGSLSEVFKAEDMKSKRVVALKKYRMKREHRYLYESAAAEMAFLKLLYHENIMKFIDCDIKKEYMYLATEYSEFGSLTRVIYELGPIPEKLIQLVMKQLISALAYLHRMHIIHEDVNRIEV